MSGALLVDKGEGYMVVRVMVRDFKRCWLFLGGNRAAPGGKPPALLGDEHVAEQNGGEDVVGLYIMVIYRVIQ